MTARVSAYSEFGRQRRRSERITFVDDHWATVLTALIPLALVVALSPISVVPAVLVLHSPRPRPTSLAFLGGWVFGLSALTAIFVAASNLLADKPHSPPAWVSWVRVALGTALIAFGVYKWLTRRRHTATPRWMSPFAKLTPVRAALTGTALAPIRPEVLMLGATAGLEIGTGGLSAAGEWLCAILFVAVCASTVAIPVLAYAAAGDKLDDALTRLKNWMEENHGAMEAAIFVVIGLMVLYKGIESL